MVSLLPVAALADILGYRHVYRSGILVFCLASIGWGIAILVAAVAPSMPLELAALLFVGYGSITFNSMAKTVLQLAASPEMRGRVMALWGLAWLGSTPIGGPIVGWIGQEAGARWSLVVGGVPTLLCGLLALPALVKIDHRRGGPSRPAAAMPRWLPSFIPNGRGASPDQPITDRCDEASDANTTTELR